MVLHKKEHGDQKLNGRENTRSKLRLAEAPMAVSLPA
jgi:hypothetical protein